MARSLAVLVVLLCAAPLASAQDAPAGTIVGGYAYVRDLASGQLPGVTFDTGWMAAGTVRLGKSRWSGMGEIGDSRHRTPFDEQQRLFAVLGGARFDLFRAFGTSMVVYAAGQAGAERFTEPGLSEWGFAFQPGAGVDVTVWSRLIARVQADYRMTQAGGSTYHRVRFIAGAGVTF